MSDFTAPNVVIISFLKIAMVALMILALVQTQENAHPSLLRALHIWLESFCLQMSFKVKYSGLCVTRQYFHKSHHIEDHTKFCLFVQSWSAYNWVDAATWPRGSGESWRSGPLSKSWISLLLYFSMYLYLYLWDLYFCLWFISIFVFVFSSISTGLHKLWYPGIRDTSTWSKFRAHGEYGDVFLFSKLGALWFSENLIRHSLHICLREVKNNLFSFKNSYLRHFSWRF